MLRIVFTFNMRISHDNSEENCWQFCEPNTSIVLFVFHLLAPRLAKIIARITVAQIPPIHNVRFQHFPPWFRVSLVTYRISPLCKRTIFNYHNFNICKHQVICHINHVSKVGVNLSVNLWESRYLSWRHGGWLNIRNNFHRYFGQMSVINTTVKRETAYENRYTRESK